MDAEKRRSTKRGRRRPVHFVLRDEDCPGLIDFLDSLEDRMAGRTMRAILFKWVEEQNRNGSADLIVAAMQAVNDHDLAVLQNKLGVRVSVRDTTSVEIAQKPLVDLSERQKPSYLPLPTPEPVATHVHNEFVEESGTPDADKEKGESSPPTDVSSTPADSELGVLDSILGLNE